MKTITVEVQEDHLEVLARTKPITAMAELIWNALDAEATVVRIAFLENDLEGLERIRVEDNGTGLSYEDALVGFRNLGGSWKVEGMRTRQRKRAIHGKYGRGRFRAFSLGNHAEWRSIYGPSGGRHGFRITGHASKLGEFTVTNPHPTPDSETGMAVEISDLTAAAGLLRGTKPLEEITAMFALYLRQYPDVRIVYDSVPLNPANAEERFTNYDLGEHVMENGERVILALTVVEWNIPGKRGVYLCDEEGFMLHNALPRLHFRGFSYTAYLKSAHLAALDREGLLTTGELIPDLRQILDIARAKLREHFAYREAERAQDVLVQWKEQDLYPYEREPQSDGEATERHIFDIYATHLHQIFPEFATATPRNKKLTLLLMRELVHSDPTRVARVLDAVLEFPEDKEEVIRELAGI